MELSQPQRLLAISAALFLFIFFIVKNESINTDPSLIQVAGSGHSREVSENHIDIHGIDVTYLKRAGTSSCLSVLLLHGAAFDAQTWKDLKTFDDLGEQYAVVAPTIPRELIQKSKLEEIFDALQLNANHTVIVSPSLSGKLSVPYVLGGKDLAGAVFVAPVTGGIPSNAQIEIPTLAIYGENDTRGKMVSEKLKTAANNNGAILEIKNGSHPCYLDDPDAFHKKVGEFLANVEAAVCAS